MTLHYNKLLIKPLILSRLVRSSSLRYTKVISSFVWPKPVLIVATGAPYSLANVAQV